MQLTLLASLGIIRDRKKRISVRATVGKLADWLVGTDER